MKINSLTFKRYSYIVDVLMGKRQRKWQNNKMKKGLCSICGKYPLAKKSKCYCDICLAKRRVKATIRRNKGKDEKNLRKLRSSITV